MDLALLTVLSIHLHVGAIPIAQFPNIPQIPRDQWKDCYYDQTMEPCSDRRSDDDIQITWRLRQPMTFRFQPTVPIGGGRLFRDGKGHLWKELLLPQGNFILTNVKSGTEIFVPLRFPCKPPLIGEVGYCRHH